jgi:hypothetical protein
MTVMWRSDHVDYALDVIGQGVAANIDPRQRIGIQAAPFELRGADCYTIANWGNWPERSFDGWRLTGPPGRRVHKRD